MTSHKVKIKEIFSSIQGEGLYIGVNQLFIRFTKCNLNCKYCDTDFISNTMEYTIEQLCEEVKKYQNIHSISLTGAEPLMEADFLSDFLKKTDKPIYLETNGTLYKELEKIIDRIDIIAMDIKLPSSSLNGDCFEQHKKFIEAAVKNRKEIFLKVVFDENIEEEEIYKTVDLAKIADLTIVLQPKTENNLLKTDSKFLNNILNRFCSIYKNVRLIPQVHKFINVR